MKIISLDPGGGTGYAMWSGHLDRDWDPDDVVMGCLSEKDHHLSLQLLLQAEMTILSSRPGLPRIAVPGAQVVCEGFDHTDNRAADLISLEYIGVTKAFCQQWLIPYVRSSRANKDVNYLKGAALKDFGLWHESKDARDAARHLVWHLVFKLNYSIPLYYRQLRRSGL
jgi:hypothetical protein